MLQETVFKVATDTAAVRADPASLSSDKDEFAKDGWKASPLVLLCALYMDLMWSHIDSTVNATRSKVSDHPNHSDARSVGLLSGLSGSDPLFDRNFVLPPTPAMAFALPDAEAGVPEFMPVSYARLSSMRHGELTTDATAELLRSCCEFYVLAVSAAGRDGLAGWQQGELLPWAVERLPVSVLR